VTTKDASSLETGIARFAVAPDRGSQVVCEMRLNHQSRARGRVAVIALRTDDRARNAALRDVTALVGAMTVLPVPSRVRAQLDAQRLPYLVDRDVTMRHVIVRLQVVHLLSGLLLARGLQGVRVHRRVELRDAMTDPETVRPLIV
jgi:hypothetical protein